MSTVRNVSLAVLLAGLGYGFVLQAAEPDPSSPPTKQTRATMAAAHEKMAACLRSDKPIAACRDQMRQNAAMMHEQGCPMMDGHGHMGPGPAPQDSGTQR